MGYHVRLDAAATKSTRLLFCTTGILLRRLAGDPLLSSTTHVVVDEVHERTLQGDFLLALLKKLITQRRAMGFSLKVLVMSATMDAELLRGYFDGCPVLSAAGRTFPVEHLFLEDAYEAVGYRLDAEAPAALRGGGVRASAALQGAVSGKQRGIVRVGSWVFMLWLQLAIIHCLINNCAGRLGRRGSRQPAGQPALRRSALPVVRPHHPRQLGHGGRAAHQL